MGQVRLAQTHEIVAHDPARVLQALVRADGERLGPAIWSSLANISDESVMEVFCFIRLLYHSGDGSSASLNPNGGLVDPFKRIQKAVYRPAGRSTGRRSSTGGSGGNSAWGSVWYQEATEK